MSTPFMKIFNNSFPKDFVTQKNIARQVNLLDGRIDFCYNGEKAEGKHAVLHRDRLGGIRPERQRA